MEIVSLVIGAVIGFATSWYVSKKFYDRANADLKKENARLVDELRSTNTIEYFSHLLKQDVWEKEWIDNVEVWTARKNKTFSIAKTGNYEPFDEPWSRGHPDASTSKLSVYLSINGTKIKELIFVSLDGGRILVPLPERLIHDDVPIYFWRPDSVEFSVGKIIGHYYIYEDIEGVAKRCRVEVVRESHLRATKN